MTSSLLIDSDSLPGASTPYAVNVAPIPSVEIASENVRYVRFASPPPRDATLKRIAHLREIADDESILVSESSVKDLHLLLNGWPGANDPSIFLLDNGNFRVVWASKEGRQIGIQFLGSELVQFVLFARRAGATEVSRSAGRDTLEGVKMQIRSLGLMSLLYL